jgi:Mor family transcriptional regulator
LTAKINRCIKVVRSLDTLDLNELNKEELPAIYSTIMNEIGLDNTLKLARMFSGQYVYFQKIETVERPLRDRKIRQEFNGYNYCELAKRYNLTEITIRTICGDLADSKRHQPMDGQLTFISNS